MKKTIQTLSALALAAAGLMGSVQTARADWFECNATEVFEFVGSRIHVRCSNTITLNGNVIRFLAIPTTAAHANRFTSEGQAAVLSGKKFVVDIPASSATNTAGCWSGDCRTPTVFGVKN